MDDLMLLKGQFPEKDWYWANRRFSNKGFWGQPDNYLLNKNINDFLRKVNMNPSTEIKKIEYLKNDDECTDVLITYRYKLSKEELEKENKEREKIFKENIVGYAKEEARFKERMEGDFPNEIAKNLWVLRKIVDESDFDFACETGIEESDIRDVESGKKEITDEMLRAIKKRFPCISIKTFTNGEREDF